MLLHCLKQLEHKIDPCDDIGHDVNNEKANVSMRLKACAIWHRDDIPHDGDHHQQVDNLSLHRLRFNIIVQNLGWYRSQHMIPVLCLGEEPFGASKVSNHPLLERLSFKWILLLVAEHFGVRLDFVDVLVLVHQHFLVLVHCYRWQVTRATHCFK